MFSTLKCLKTLIIMSPKTKSIFHSLTEEKLEFKFCECTDWQYCIPTVMLKKQL